MMMKLNQPSYRQLTEFWGLASKSEANATPKAPTFAHLSTHQMRGILNTMQSDAELAPTGAASLNFNALENLRDKVAVAVNFITKKPVTVPLHEVATHQFLATKLQERHPIHTRKTHVNLENGIPVLRTILDLKESQHAYEIKSRIPNAPLNTQAPRAFELTLGTNKGDRFIPLASRRSQ
jgi:hypothetical protein